MSVQCSLFQRSLYPGDLLRGLLTFSRPDSSKSWGSSPQDSWRMEVIGIMDGVSKLDAETLKGFVRRTDGGYLLLSAEHTSSATDAEGNLAYYFSVCLPDCLPPTYRGPVVKFSYIVVIEVMRKLQRVASLKVPFRIRPRHGCLAAPSASSVCSLTVISLHASEPVDCTLLPATRTPALGDERDITYAPGLFHVSQTDEHGSNVHVVSLILNTKTVRVGSQLHGLLDFAAAEIACSQVELSLVMKELHGSTCISNTVYHAQRIETDLCVTSSFAIALPKSAPSTLECSLVTVMWEIELKFMMSSNILSWCLPVTVLPRMEPTNLVMAKAVLIS